MCVQETGCGTRLEALTQRIVEETHKYRMQLDTETAEHKRALTIEFDEKAKALEAQYEQRSEAVEARAQELDEVRRDLDDRSARHARRQQSKELQDKISGRSKKFELTYETQHKRRSIHAIFILLLVTSVSLIVRSLLFPVATTEGVALWLELGRLPLGVLGFALTSVFYIRWNDQWFRQHANQEFRFQQLALDVDRAGYAVEMLMEWQEEKGSEMPAVMVDRLTTGLFTDQTTEARVRHPAEDLTSALGLGRLYGSVEADVARGLALRMDHGSQYLSDHFLNQLRYWGIHPSFSFVEEPETNGVVERWNRTLKEQAIYGRVFHNLAEVRAAVAAFVERYNQCWRLEKLAYRTPLEAREEYELRHAA